MAVKFFPCNLSYSYETPGFNRHFCPVIVRTSHSHSSLFIHTVSQGMCVCVCGSGFWGVCVRERERERETLNISEVCVSALFSVTEGPASGVQWHFIKSLAFALPPCSAVPDYLLIPLCVCVCSWKCAGVCDRRSVTQTLRALLELHNSFVAYMFVACVLMCMCISVSVFAAASEVNVSYCEHVAMETTDITG